MQDNKIHDLEGKDAVKQEWPKNLTKVIRNIVDAKEDAIIQQCNCTSITAHGLAQTLADEFDTHPYKHRQPMKSIYNGRPLNRAIDEDCDTPGTYRILLSDPDDLGQSKSIVCLFGQWSPGKVGVPYQDRRKPDDAKDRQHYFITAFVAFLHEWCAADFARPGTIKSLAIPWVVGSGMAGGNKNWYLECVVALAKAHPHVKFVFYQLPKVKSVDEQDDDSSDSDD